MKLCQYKNIFGVPGQGVHSFKFLGTSMFDYLGTILMAMALTWLTDTPLVLTTIFMFAIGILSHYVFCIPTDTIKFLFR
jgi:hypothetical protein